MKVAILLVVLWMSTLCIKGQSVGIGTTNPHGSSALEISSNSKGVLIPRLTTTQRTGIGFPAEGLLVFDTDTDSFWFFNGTAWVNLSSANTANTWSILGNSGTNPANHFIGTVDNNPLRFRVNNFNAGFIDFSSSNTAYGYNALNYTGTGIANTGIGKDVLYSNTTGVLNTAMGYNAMYLNSTGSYNSAIGIGALYSNELGNYNTALGAGALNDNYTGNENIAIGFRALLSNVNGNSNIAIGKDALYKNISGIKSIAIGDSTLYHQGGGIGGNVAIGNKAMFNNTSGKSNVAIGNHTLTNTDKGRNLVAIGDSAMHTQFTFSSEPSIGNTAVGSLALYNHKPGNYNTAIGYNTKLGSDPLSFVELNNATAIGANAVVNSSNSVQLGDENVSLVRTAGDMVVRGNRGVVSTYNGLPMTFIKLNLHVEAVLEWGRSKVIPFSFPTNISFSSVSVGQITNVSGGAYWQFLNLKVFFVNPSTGAGELWVSLPPNYYDTPPVNYSFDVAIIGIGSD